MPNLPVVFHQEVLHIDPENPRQGEQIVHRGQRFSPLPFVDCLRVLKTKVVLQIPYGQPPLPAQCGNPLTGALHIDGGKCCFLIHSFSAPFLFDIPFPSMVSGRFYHTIPSHVGSGGDIFWHSYPENHRFSFCYLNYQLYLNQYQHSNILAFL